MNGTIRVEPAKLKSTASQIDAQAAQYKRLYEQLYTEVNAMKSAWNDAANIAFTSQVEGFKEDLEKMYKLMTQYSEFLVNAANTYETAQNNLIDGAKRLAN